MFTGIIEATGTIASLIQKSGDVRLKVRSSALDFTDVSLGDSIATSGICLTVVDFGRDWYAVDVSKETLGVTALSGWQVGTVVNLEKAMLPSTRFGGHIVSGHVDAVGSIVKKRSDARSIYFEVALPKTLAGYVAKKGSLTVDGISLTTNDIKDTTDACIACLNIVPHTVDVTSIGNNWAVGARVNVEVDVIARYLERLMLHPHSGAANHVTNAASPTTNSTAQHGTSTLTESFLAEHGFLSR